MESIRRWQGRTEEGRGNHKTIQRERERVRERENIFLLIQYRDLELWRTALDHRLENLACSNEDISSWIPRKYEHSFAGQLSLRKGTHLTWNACTTRTFDSQRCVRHYNQHFRPFAGCVRMGPRDGSHFCLPPSSIRKMTGWVAILCELWRMLTGPTSLFLEAWPCCITKQKNASTQAKHHQHDEDEQTPLKQSHWHTAKRSHRCFSPWCPSAHRAVLEPVPLAQRLGLQRNAAA